MYNTLLSVTCNPHHMTRAGATATVGGVCDKQLIILGHYSQASEWATRYIRNCIMHFNPGPDKYFTLGLPTGCTPLGCYKKLIECYKNGDLSVKYVKTFNMDKCVGRPRDHSEGYHSFMWNNFKHTDIPPENIHILDGMQLTCRLNVTPFKRRSRLQAGLICLLEGRHRPRQTYCLQ